MNKKLLWVMVGLMLIITTPASSFTTKDGDVNPIPITRGTSEGGPDGRPRTPVQPLFTANLDTDLNNISISAFCYVGEVDIVIENLTTGEYIEDEFDSSVTSYFPISGNTGLWHITLTLDSGDNYYGVFVL